MYFGCGDRFPADLASSRARAREARMKSDQRPRVAGTRFLKALKEILPRGSRHYSGTSAGNSRNELVRGLATLPWPSSRTKLGVAGRDPSERADWPLDALPVQGAILVLFAGARPVVFSLLAAAPMALGGRLGTGSAGFGPMLGAVLGRALRLSDSEGGHEQHHQSHQ